LDKPGAQVQTESTHETELAPPPASQTCPQPPQLVGLEVTLMQAPSQATLPPVHPQDPLMQSAPSAQISPHAPQLFRSISVFTQPPGQEVPPPGQRHTPSLQLVPSGQATPQSPQLASSSRTSMHAPPQIS